MSIKLQAQTRAKKEKLEKNFMNAVVYGQGSENILLKIKTNDFIKVYNEAGESNLVELEIDGKGGFNVLIKDIQKDPIKDFLVHADFYKVDMNKEVNAEIPFNFIGESKAVKELGALLIKNINDISVECLPKDLVDHIDIDISVLTEIGSVIHIKDIKLPAGLKISNNLDDVVATTIEQKEEKEEPIVPASTEGSSTPASGPASTSTDKSEKK